MTVIQTPDGVGWRQLPRVAQLYVAAVIFAGAYALATVVPATHTDPVLFGVMLVLASLASIWKVTLPISVNGHSTLSVAYAADVMVLVLLGPAPAVIVAAMGAWAQCTINVKGRYPLYRTVFSVAAKAITMAAAGLTYLWLDGPSADFKLSLLTKPLVGTIAAYFLVNTGLIAGAIALSTAQRIWAVWRDDFLWSASSFMVGGSAGAMIAVVIERGEHWKALLLLAPVYLTYRTYQIFTGRLEDQKRHEQAIAEEREREKAARASAERANQLKDEFLAMVSHELRTPLTAVLGWAEMLRSGKLENGRRDRACQAIYDSAKRQARMIDELLDVARITSGKLGVYRTAVDLSGVLHDALEVVQPAAEAKRIQIETDIDPSLGAMYGDGARLQQIAWNLLSNAVKFTPAGGFVRVRLRRGDHGAELIVSDNGPGIAGDFLPVVFEPFRQADASTTRVHGGLGVGLAIVKHLAEAHGGTVTAESRGEGRGATFTVRLPLVSIPASWQGDVGHLSAAAPLTLDGISVLLVDDDEDSRQVIASHLERHHAVVLTAASCPQAWDVLQHEHVDVLLSDIAMPGEDGYALVGKVRASATSRIASIPAVALTALARDEDRQRALRAGFQLHLAKPIEARSLVTAVATLGKAAVASSLGSV
jgi:signal transduction histidine kinase/ActR/RegA family two-component response regulator